MATVNNLKKAVIFGAIYYILQVFLYVFSLALGPEAATRKTLQISLYGLVTVLTFPFVYLLEKLQWSGWGLSAFFLNSLFWSAIFYLILIAVKK